MPIADMVLTADTSQVKTATQVVDKFRESLLKLAKNQQELEKTLKDYTRESRAEVSSMRERLAFSKRMEAQKAKEARQVEISAGKAERARLKQEKAAEAVAAAEERLRHKYIEGYTAADLYSKELNDLAVARQKEIISADQQAAEVAALNKHYQAGTGIFANYANQMGKSANRMGMAMQQTGYQVGDFLVQIQGGTNPMVAFGQQATQLVGVMYLLPQATLAAKVSIAGLAISVSTIAMGLGILIPLATAIGAAFMRTREAAENASSGVDDLASSFESLEQSLRSYERAKEASEAGISVDEWLSVDAINRAVVALAEAEAHVESLLTPRVPVAGIGDWFMQGADAIVGFLSEEIENAQADVLAKRAVLVALQNRQEEQQLRSFHEREAAMRAELALMEEIARFGEDSSQVRRLESEQALAEELRRINALEASLDISAAQATILRGLVRDTSEAADEAERIEAALDSVTSLSFATLTDSIRALGIELGISADEAGRLLLNHGLLAEMAANSTPLGWMRGLFYGDSRAEPESTGSSGGGGGGAEGPDRIGALAQSLASEQELLDIWREDSLAALEEFNARELALLEAHGDARTLIEEEYQSRLREIRNAERANTLTGYGDLFGALGSLMGNSGKKLLQIQAGLSAAATMISTYEGAAAQASKMKDPISAGAVWAAWIARGISAVAKIKQIGSSGNASSGGVGGGGGAGGIATPDGSGSGPQKILIEGLNPGDMLSGEMLKELFDRIYDENDNRGAVFMVST